MPVYSPTQLIGKTIFLQSSQNYYDVFDINNLGDNAKPIGTIKSFVLDSYLLPTQGYINSYGIKYAKRDYTYFTFYQSGKYYAVRFNVNNINTDALKQQGSLTIAEEIEKQKEDSKDIFDKLFSGLHIGKSLKTVLIIALSIAIVVFVLPHVLKAINKNKK